MSWEPSYDVYLTRLDGALASVVVDLHARPLPSHPRCVVVSTTLKVQRDDGLRDESEFDGVGRLEDQLVDTLTQLGACFVGRVVSKGQVRFVFYLPRAPEALPAAIEGYPLTVQDADEPAWSTFGRVLFPNLYELQCIFNRRLLVQLENAGDRLDVARSLDHLAFFDSTETAANASHDLKTLGFFVEPPVKADDGRMSLEFRRDDVLANGRVDEVCAEVLEVLARHHGDYDGWGCPIVKAN